MLNIALVLALSFIAASASSLGCDGDVLPDGTICDWHDGEIHVSHKMIFNSVRWVVEFWTHEYKISLGLKEISMFCDLT